MKILVTGATGFVGRALVPYLLNEKKWSVRAAVRLRGFSQLPGAEIVTVSDCADDSDWRDALSGIDVVVHLAGRAHVTREAGPGRMGEFRRVNVLGTMQLARQAVKAGVGRFVFLSSVKVNGDGRIKNIRPGGRDGLAVNPDGFGLDAAYQETDLPDPQDDYAISKHEAELGLQELAAATGLELVIIRPPLVYGPGVKANFRTLIRSVGWGLPLPFGRIQNCRSLVALTNLIDFIGLCIESPFAANELFLVSDGEDLSTSDLICRLAEAMHRKVILFPVPLKFLLAVARILGKDATAVRLFGTLRVDISKAQEVLHWAPKIGVTEGLARTVARGANSNG